VTKRDLYNILFKTDSAGKALCPLYQDRVMYVLMHNELMGKDKEELCSFKKKNFNYMAKALNVHNDKIIYLEDWEAEVIQRAIEEEDYSEDPLRSCSDTFKCMYVESDFVLKRRYVERGRYVRVNNESREPVLSQTITGRLKAINDLLGTPYLTSQALYTSGIVYRMLQEKKDWKLVEITRYLNENNIPLTTQRVNRGINIMKMKLEAEESLQEVSVTNE